MSTAWLVREQYRHAARVAAVLGAVVGFMIVLLLAWVRSERSGGPPPSLAVGDIAIILVTTLVPPLVVMLLWRRVYKRRFQKRPEWHDGSYNALQGGSRASSSMRPASVRSSFGKPS